MKKVIFLILILLLAWSMCSSVFSETKATVYKSGDYNYVKLKDGTLQITKYSGKSKELTIPEKLDGYKVTGIGDRAFNDCSFLASVIIPDTITRIAINPFTSCRNLKKIYISPDHPTLSIIDGVLFDKTEKRLITYPPSSKEAYYTIPDGICVIGSYAFFDCTSLKKITLPIGITDIGNNAFASCDNLSIMTIPEGVTNIGERAFYECYSLSYITIPNSVVSIGERAFLDCKVLEEIILPKELEKISEWTFHNCKSLSRITWPDKLTTIEKMAFGNCNFTKIHDLPDSLTSIANDAFDGCPTELLFTVSRDSYASQWCKENYANHAYPDSYDWLKE